jgi:5'(3')-deoxyribonucleotidase
VVDQLNNNKRKRVLLDVDGVLADFCSVAVSIVNRVCGTSFTSHDVTEFDICGSLGVSKEDAAKVKREIGSYSGLASTLAVYPGAREGVAKLRTIADVVIVTSPWNSNPTWTFDREQWLLRHFGIPHRDVIHTGAKHCVVGDVLVDDKTSTCDEWRLAHPHGVAVQWSTLHNRRDLWDGPSTCDWDHLIEIVRTGAIDGRFDDGGPTP